MNKLKILFLMSVYTPMVLAPKWKTKEEEIIGEEDVILKIEAIGIIEEVIEIIKVREVVVEDLIIKMIMIIREKHAKLLKKMTMIHLKSRKSVKKKSNSNSTKMMLLKKINSLRDANSLEKISHQEKINKINSNRETPIQII